MTITYPVAVERRARYSDLDPTRRLGRDALLRWFEDARVAVERGPLDSLAASSLRIAYLAEVLYPAINQLRVGVVEVDESSVRYACGLFDGPRCIGLAEATGGLSPRTPGWARAWRRSRCAADLGRPAPSPGRMPPGPGRAGRRPRDPGAPYIARPWACRTSPARPVSARSRPQRAARRARARSSPARRPRSSPAGPPS